MERIGLVQGSNPEEPRTAAWMWLNRTLNSRCIVSNHQSSRYEANQLMTTTLIS